MRDTKVFLYLLVLRLSDGRRQKSSSHVKQDCLSNRLGLLVLKLMIAWTDYDFSGPLGTMNTEAPLPLHCPCSTRTIIVSN